MIGQCIIDGIDIYTKYGVFIANSGYDGLLSFPAIMPPETNDWAEEHGVEVDLSQPQLQAQELTVEFANIGGNWRNFYVFMANTGLRSVTLPCLARTLKLRVVEMPLLASYNGVDLFSIKFAHSIDIPDGYPAANADRLPGCVLTLDGRSWDKYGIIIIDGLDELSKAPKLKRNLIGTEVDKGLVRYAAKQVTFKCCLSATQAVVFQNLYNAFFGDLLKPGLRKIGYAGKTYDAYYLNSSNWRLLSPTSEIVCEFNLTLCFTAFKIGGDIYLLATQDDRLVETQDGRLIDLDY